MSKARTWTCQRVKAGERCGRQWPRTKARCECGGRRPKPRPPAHMRALDVPYEDYIAINGGEHCGICGKEPTDKRMQRDHDHRSGEPRGLLCFQDNRQLRTSSTKEWLDAAWRYLVRDELRGLGRLQFVHEDRGHGSDCWIWQRAKSSTGYGVLRFQGQFIYVHRLMHHGYIPDGFQVDHLCRQRDCANPQHLQAVPPVVNTRRAGKLTQAQVDEIRRRRAAGETTVALGAEFGVNHAHISRVTRGLLWAEDVDTDQPGGFYVLGHMSDKDEEAA